MKKQNNLLFGAIIFVIAFISLVSAPGTSSPNTEDRPLQISPGETKIVEFNLQNMVGNEDVTVEVVISEGADIASLERTTYTARVGTYDTMIPVTISIPENYNKNVQRVKLEFKTVSESQGDGIVSIGAGWITPFNVFIDSTEPAASKGSLITLLVIVVAILAISVVFLIVRRRNEYRTKYQ